MKTQFINSKQANIRLLTGVVNSEIINERSIVLKYGQNNKYGYQRELNTRHVNGILTYINKHKENCIFPNSIILALDEEDFKKQIDVDIDTPITELSLNSLNFRTVDGQHRLEAIKKSIYDFDLSVIIMIIPENNRKIELEVFTTINSKAKRIPTDLAELAKYRYLLIESKDTLLEKDSVDYVAMKIIIDLNKDDNSCWYGAIKVDVNEEDNQGIVGVSAFKKTLMPIISDRISQKNLDIDLLDNEASNIKNELNTIWDICIKKWKYCFKVESEEKYSKNYYIQKTLGMSVIHGILKEIYKNPNGNFDETFKTIIMNSNVTTDDWEVGGIMSGYSSESGFLKIRKLIKNEIKKL
jgi:DGQHR domain-containing protein